MELSLPCFLLQDPTDRRAIYPSPLYKTLLASNTSNTSNTGRFPVVTFACDLQAASQSIEVWAQGNADHNGSQYKLCDDLDVADACS